MSEKTALSIIGNSLMEIVEKEELCLDDLKEIKESQSSTDRLEALKLIRDRVRIMAKQAGVLEEALHIAALSAVEDMP